MGSAVCRRWTQEEKDFVEDNWGVLSSRVIARRLSRTETAIIRYAERNKLGGSMLNSSFMSTTTTSSIIGVDPTSVIMWIKNKQLKARTKSLKRRVIYLVDPKDFKQFLLDNPTKWKVKNYTEDVFNFGEDYLSDKLQKENTIPKHKNLWTTKEEYQLIDMINKGYTSKEISMTLGRTTASIRHKRLRLVLEV